MDLLALAMLCGPLVNPATTLRVISMESAGNPYVIHDNTDGVSYRAVSLEAAVGASERLIAAGHRIDVGLMQINYKVWLKPAGVSPRAALSPCTNVRLGTTLLSANYAHALNGSDAARALYRALSAYNTGRYSDHSAYAEGVLRAPSSSHPIR